MRKIMVEELYHSVQKIEKFYYLRADVVSEVADVVAIAARMGVRVEWIGKTLDEIAANHFVLLQNN